MTRPKSEKGHQGDLPSGCGPMLHPTPKPPYDDVAVLRERIERLERIVGVLCSSGSVAPLSDATDRAEGGPVWRNPHARYPFP